MGVITISTPTAPLAPQSCLICRRVVTKREQHDELEERVLASIRAEHPEWEDAREGSAPHVEHYRELLQLRKKRAARARAERLRARVRRYRVRMRLRALARKCSLLLHAGDEADEAINAAGEVSIHNTQGHAARLGTEGESYGTP